MRRTLSLLIAILLLLPMTLVLSGCSKEEISVESLLEIDSRYNGHRRITIMYPLSVDTDSLSESLSKNNPLAEFKESKFEYVGVEEDGHKFVMDLVFDSKDEYLELVETLVGHEVTSYLAQPDTVLTKGTRMIEDFDASDLIGWVIDTTKSIDETSDLEFDYSRTNVKIGDENFKTGSRIDITDLRGEAIDSITIDTTNLKDGTFDRTITFLIPDKTYKRSSDSIESYFKANTDSNAHYCDFTNKGDVWEYKVIYKGISLDDLEEYTAMLLDSDDQRVDYGDINNISTPLSEGLVFEETLNTFSFIGNNGLCVDIDYTYALPSNSNYSDGTVYTNGSWKTDGMWQNGVYNVSLNSDVMSIRISDGKDYAINGIRFDLEIVDDNEFVRTTEFLYSKSQGADGMKYAQKYFESKGVEVTSDKDEENLICRVVSKGNCQQITEELVKCFGSGNYIAYEIDKSAFSLSSKTTFTDNIDFKSMLNSTNANRPMTYTVHSSGKESMIDIACDGSEIIQNTDDKDALSVQVKGGVGMVVYHGSNPDMFSVVIYVIIGFMMLALTVLAILLMLKKQRNKETLESDGVSYAPEQTTTFSIAELMLLTDKTDKKLREEIDRDINEKIESDRIVALAKELKEKEVEQLIKMVYGEDAAISKGESVQNEESFEETDVE